MERAVGSRSSSSEVVVVVDILGFLGVGSWFWVWDEELGF